MALSVIQLINKLNNRNINNLKIRIELMHYGLINNYPDRYIRLREDIHYYSVSHTHIGKKFKISYTASDVEIFDGYT
jgi:hypothetical protein